MPKAKNPKAEEAKALFLQGKKLVEISAILNLPEGTVRRWKSTYKWDNERSGKKTSVRNKSGAPLGNKNAVGDGAPPGNKNAEKHGLFSKYLPAETLELVETVGTMDPLDVLWDQITIQYAAIIRAQRIMYVKDQDDMTKVVVADGAASTGYEVQQAWDKQANFLQAQSRAMTALNGMIKNYDELLHKKWGLATEEQRARIEKLRAETARVKGEEPEDNKEDDGFMDALKGEVKEIWQE